MTKSVARAARALTIAVAAILGSNAADAAARIAASDAPNASPALTYVVRYADLDLSKADGAATLYARLRHAATIVCAPFESFEIAQTADHRACMNSAIADAVTTIDRPAVSQYYESLTGGKYGLVRVSNAR